jgi:Domain of unknown function (DUF1996)
MRVNIQMRDCWNGRDLFLPGNAHMAFSSADTGACPAGFVRTWGLRLELSYTLTPEMTWSGGVQPPLFLGGPQGNSPYGTHMDFVNG